MQLNHFHPINNSINHTNNHQIILLASSILFAGVQSIQIGEGKSKIVKCPHSHEQIYVTSAFYGLKGCGDPKKSLQKCQATCDGSNSCNVKAINSVFGDPCPGKGKVLSMSYQCVPVFPGIYYYYLFI